MKTSEITSEWVLAWARRVEEQIAQNSEAVSSFCCVVRD